MEHVHDEKCGHHSGTCGCPCHRMTGLFAVGVGVVFLLGALDVISQQAVSITWPIFVILAGLKKASRGLCKCCKDA